MSTLLFSFSIFQTLRRYQKSQQLCCILRRARYVYTVIPVFIPAHIRCGILSPRGEDSVAANNYRGSLNQDRQKKRSRFRRTSTHEESADGISIMAARGYMRVRVDVDAEAGFYLAL